MAKLDSATVIIPAYNASSFIRRTIESVLEQEHHANEVYIIDDGSTDNTQEVVETYGEEVIYVYQPNAGAGTARNIGAQLAQSKYLFFLDAGDELVPASLRVLLTAIRKYPNAAAIFGAYQQMEEYDAVRIPEENRLLHRQQGLGIVEDMFEVMALWDCVRAGNVLVRKDILMDVGMFPTGRAHREDLYTWSCIAGRYDWAFFDAEVCTRHEERAANEEHPDVSEIQWIFDEETMKKNVRESHWESYRIFRREEVLRLCHKLARAGEVERMRDALEQIAPAPTSSNWDWYAKMSLKPGWMVKAAAAVRKWSGGDESVALTG